MDLKPCALLLSAALAGLAGCQKPAVPGVSDEEVVLGVSGPLSGPGAAWGSVALGARAWAAHVNAQGGVHGRRIRVLLKDDAYVPGRAVTNVTEMKDSVFALVTLVGTAVASAVKDVVAEAGLPVVFPTANVRIWAAQPREKIARVFVAYPDYQADGAYLGEQVAAQAGARRVAVLYQNDDYGKDGLEGLERGLAEAGAELAAAVPYEVQDREMGLHALKLKESGAEAAVLFATPTHAANAVKEMAKVGYRPALFASFVLGDYRVMFRLLGELWSGVYFTAWLPPPGNPETDRIVSTLLAQDPGLEGRELFAAVGAGAMITAVEGLKRSGRDLTREAFVSALEDLRDWRPEGVGAPVSFGPGRRHGLNTLRLYRAGKTAAETPAPLTDYRPLPALF